MRIITSYPIIKNGKVVANNCYNTTLDYSSVTGTNPLPKFSDSNVFSKPFVAPINVVKPDIGKASGGASSTKTGRNIDFESLGDKASAGIKGFGNLLGLFKKPKGSTAPKPTPTPTMPENQGMSTGTKIAIGVGAVAVIGALIYFAKK